MEPPMPAQRGLTDILLDLCDTYCDTVGIARSTLSGWMLNDGRTLERVATGGSMTVRNFEVCMAWLSTNWPAALPWPKGVDRPAAQAKLKSVDEKATQRRLRRVAA